MNKNYLSIDFQSKLTPDEMLARLREKFPEAGWHGSDTETGGAVTLLNFQGQASSSDFL